MLAMGDEALVQLAGEHRDAVHPGVVVEPMAGHADLAAAGLEQGALIEVGPLLDRAFKPGGQGFGQTRTQQQMTELDMADRKAFNTMAQERLPALENRTRAIETLEQVIDLIPEEGGVGTLPEREAQADALRLLGVPIPKDFFNQDQASVMQAVDGAINDYVAILVESMKGNPSDADLMLQFKRAPSGNNTREANRAIVNNARRLIELEKEKIRIGYDYLNNPDPETGTLGRPSEFQTDWSKVIEPALKKKFWREYPGYQPRQEDELPANDPMRGPGPLAPRQPSPFARPAHLEAF
jgi:hypothetical protein